jgi:hypothetical protein
MCPFPFQYLQSLWTNPSIGDGQTYALYLTLGAWLLYSIMNAESLPRGLALGPDAFLFIGLATLPDMDYNEYSDLHTLGGYLRQSTPTLAAMQRCAKAVVQMMLPDTIPMLSRDSWLNIIGTKSLDGRYRVTKRTLVAMVLNSAFNRNAIRRITPGCTVADIEVSFSEDSASNLARRWRWNILGHIWCVFVAIFTHQRLAWLGSVFFGILAALCAHFCRDLGQYRSADAGDIKNMPDVVLGVSRSERLLTKINVASLPKPDIHRADFLRTPQTYSIREGPLFTAAKLFGAVCVIGHAAAAMNVDAWCRWGLTLLHLLSLVVERYRPQMARVGPGCASAILSRSTHHHCTLAACVDVANDTGQLAEVLRIMFDPSQRLENESEWLIYLWKGLEKGIERNALEQAYIVNKPIPHGSKVEIASSIIERKRARSRPRGGHVIDGLGE